MVEGLRRDANSRLSAAVGGLRMVGVRWGWLFSQHNFPNSRGNTSTSRAWLRVSDTTQCVVHVLLLWWGLELKFTRNGRQMGTPQTQRMLAAGN